MRAGVAQSIVISGLRMDKKMKKKMNKTVADDIKKKAKLFLGNIKNANNLIDILALSEVRFKMQEI